MYLSLFTVIVPGGSPIELSAADYVRRAVEFDSGRHNSAAVLFQPQRDWGRVDCIGVSRDINSAVLALGAVLPDIIVLHSGDILKIPSGALAMSGCGLSATPLQIPENSPDGFTGTFNDSADWVLDAGMYYTEIIHSLNSVNIHTEITQGGRRIFVHRVEEITTEKIRLWVPAEPDSRFAGKIEIKRI
ncbi:MAG: hypothetical protein GY862_02770 [Gammaproteobacteria bacterium]|nr:hypothetical protein [Gammaproteobacteria bacterium]